MKKDRDELVDALLKRAAKSFARWWTRGRQRPFLTELFGRTTSEQAYKAGMEIGIRSVLLMQDEVRIAKDTPDTPSSDRAGGP